MHKSALFLLFGVSFSGVALAAIVAVAPEGHQMNNLISQNQHSAAAQPEKTQNRSNWGNFVHISKIADWFAPDDMALFIRDTGGQWYKASFFGPCPKLSTTKTPAFAPEMSGYLDHTSSIVVDGERCPFASFNRSEPPKRTSGATKE